jgi:hypothetical protein
MLWLFYNQCGKNIKESLYKEYSLIYIFFLISSSVITNNMQINNLRKPGGHNIVLTQEICHLYEKRQYRIN